jgi:acetyl-CoA/propionyl-CoA carboxylase carboxyl transferase subunit
MAVMESRDPAVRLRQLMDRDTMRPFGPNGGGTLAARGRVGGAPAVGYCTDATRKGGALGAADGRTIVAAIETAVREGCPVIGLWHSGGAALADGIESMDAVGRMFAAMTRASGKVPQLSVVLGPAAGAAAYGPALTDLVIMSGGGRMFVTGPDVVRSVTGELIDMEGLGGGRVHSRSSGVAHLVADDEDEAYEHARRLVDLLTRPGRFDPAAAGPGRDLAGLLPESPRRAYDVRPLVGEIFDRPDGQPAFEEIQPRWAANVVTGLGRLVGRTVGVIASNPIHKGGCLDSLSAEKASRFVRMCDSFGIPLVVVVDVPGYLPGVRQEWDGVVRRGAKLLYAFAEAVVPRVTLITRKSYGGAYIAMNSRSLGAATELAWPGAEVAVMSAEAAVNVLHRRELAAAPEHRRPALRTRLAAEHRKRSGGVRRGLDLGLVDEVVDPCQTRRRLAETLAAASTAARGRHGNIPL